MKKKILSKYNGELEVITIDGIKMLNSRNANYSYGSLEVVFAYAFKKVDLKKVRNALLLGLGGGSVVSLLRNDHGYFGKITAVELDPVIVDIARDEFGIQSTVNLKIICANAFDFVIKTKAKFDLVVIDIFIDDKIPKQIIQQKFWEKISTLTNPSGSIIFNAFADVKAMDLIRSELRKGGFSTRLYPDVMNSNTILIAKKKQVIFFKK